MNTPSLKQTQAVTTNKFITFITLAAVVGVVVLIVLLIINSKPYFWNDLKPGTSTQSEITQKLGDPISSEEIDGQTHLKYSNTSEFRPNTLILENGTLKVVKEQVIGNERGTLATYLNKYGKAEYEGYGPHADASFKVFVFAKNGLAVVASPNDGTILEVWYFQPTTVENFKSNFEGEISDEEPHLHGE